MIEPKRLVVSGQLVTKKQLIEYPFRGQYQLILSGEYGDLIFSGFTKYRWLARWFYKHIPTHGTGVFCA